MFQNIKNIKFSKLYRLLIFVVLGILAVNLGIVVYIQKDYERDIKKEDANYLDSVYSYIERDINVRIPEMILSLFPPEEYWKYYSAYKNEESKNVLYVRLQEELKRTLYASDGFYDYAMYYPQTNELISANYGYFQLSRDKNENYRLAYSIDKSDSYHWGLNVAVPKPGGTGILLTVTYKFENGSMLIYGLGKEYFDSFFIGNTNRGNNQSGLFLLDNEETFVYANGISAEDWVDVPNFFDSVNKAAVAGPQHLGNNSSTYILTVKETDALPFKIVKINQAHIVMELKKYLLLLYCFILLIPIAILTGIVIPNYLIKKIHKPIYKLASHIGNSSDPANDAPDQLLQKIGDYVVSSKNELQEIRQVLDSSRNAIKENFIKYLFYNAESDPQSIREYTSVLKLEWPQGLYFASYLLLEPPKLSGISITDLLLQKVQLTYELENNISSDHVHIIACNNTENSLALIIQTGENTWHSDLEHLIQQITSFLENRHINHFLSIGPGEQQMSELFISSKSAEGNLTCHFYTGKDINYCIADDIRSLNCTLPPLQLILGNNPSSADVHLLLDTTKEFFTKYPFELEYCQKTLTIFVSLVLNLLKMQENSQETLEFPKIMYPLDHFWKSGDYLQFLDNLLEKQENSEIQEESEDILKKINRYVENNLSSNISLESIAEYVQLSPKYVSKVFKERAGENLTAYITRLRIEKAVELLKYTDKNVETIAFETGFSSSNYFIKCFKSKLGLSPKVYRESLEKQ